MQNGYLSAISTQSNRYIMFLSLSSPIEDDDEEVAAFDAFSFIRSVTAISSFASYREKMKIECEKEKERERLNVCVR